MNPAIELTADFLRAAEVSPVERPLHRREAQLLMGLGRVFRVSYAGENFHVSFRHCPKPAEETFCSVGEDERIPTDPEVLSLLAKVFFASLPRPEPAFDSAAAWQTYREELAATVAYPLPEWATLPAEVREAFTAALRRAITPA